MWKMDSIDFFPNKNLTESLKKVILTQDNLT